MKMSYLHPSENTYYWTRADNMVNWAKSNGFSVHGHTLIWHSDYQVPNWMKNYSGDSAAWTSMLNKHVTDIVTHFKGDMVSWDVVNEAFLDGGGYRNSIFYQKLGADYLENAFVAARAADADVDLYYNDYNLVSNVAKLDDVVDMADDFIDRGIPIDGIGFQMHIQIDYPDTDTIKAAFKKVVDLGLKVKITELDIPLNNPWSESADYPEYTSFTAAAAERQKQRYKSVVTAYLETVPADQRGGLTIWGLVDQDSWLHDLSSRKVDGNKIDDWPLLFSGPDNGPYQAKPAVDGIEEALNGM